MLQRIPVVDEIGNVRDLSHRTVFDNIQRVVTQATTTPSGRPSVVFPREAPRASPSSSVGSVSCGKLGFTPSDMSTFTSRLARYLSTSPLRRGMELDDISAYEFFVDIDRATGRADVRLQQGLRRPTRQHAEGPRCVRRFWGDARTDICRPISSSSFAWTGETTRRMASCTGRRASPGSITGTGTWSTGSESTFVRISDSTEFEAPTSPTRKLTATSHRRTPAPRRGGADDGRRRPTTSWHSTHRKRNVSPKDSQQRSSASAGRSRSWRVGRLAGRPKVPTTA